MKGAMTELEAQAQLFLDRNDRGLMIPNFCPSDWWECDVYNVLKSGHWEEWEIKCSVSDFRRDAEKKTVYTNVRKHDLLSGGDQIAPRRFWFLVSQDIAEQVMEELPVWAGLATFGNGIKVIKRPKVNSRAKKATPADIDRAKTAMVWRYWRNQILNRRDAVGKEDQDAD